MSYPIAVNRLSKKEQDKLNEIFDKWRQQPNGYIQVQNIQNEIFLDAKDMNILLKAIIKEAEFDENGQLLSDELVIKLKRKQLYRKGKEVRKSGKPHTARFIGTILPQKTLFNRLTTKHPEKSNYDYDAVRRKLKKLGKKEIKNTYGEFLIKEKNYSIWFTWNSEDTQDALSYIKSWTQNHARVELGLGNQHYEGKDLIALIFNNPAYEDAQASMLFRPTCFDSGFNFYFRPTSFPHRNNTRNKVRGYGLTFSLSKNPVFGARLGQFEGNQLEALGISGDFLLKNLHEIYFLKQGKHIPIDSYRNE